MQRISRKLAARAIVVALLVVTAGTQVSVSAAVAQEEPPVSTKGTGTKADVPAAAAPANDNLAAAQVLGGAASFVNGTNVGASLQAGEPNHADVPAEASVWYSWTAPESGPAAFSTSVADLDTVLAIYTGSSLTALTAVASNDDFGSSVKSKATFTASSGTPYKIAVAGFGVPALRERSWSQVASPQARRPPRHHTR